MIQLKEKGNKKAKFVFPSMPESVSLSSDTNYQSYSLMGRGAIKIPKGIDGSKISWSGEFFGKAKKKESIVLKNKWKEPKTCKKTLEKWQQKNAILNLVITEMGINIDVTLTSFRTEAYGGYGNIKYDITLEKTEPLKIYTTADKKKQSGKKQLKERAAISNFKRTTITAKGKTSIWKAAKEIGGLDMDWQKLYKANKDVIEATARANGLKNSDYGRYLFPGTQLTIPIEQDGETDD